MRHFAVPPLPGFLQVRHLQRVLASWPLVGDDVDRHQARDAENVPAKDRRHGLDCNDERSDRAEEHDRLPASVGALLEEHLLRQEDCCQRRRDHEDGADHCHGEVDRVTPGHDLVQCRDGTERIDPEIASGLDDGDRSPKPVDGNGEDPERQLEHGGNGQQNAQGRGGEEKQDICVSHDDSPSKVESGLEN